MPVSGPGRFKIAFAIKGADRMVWVTSLAWGSGSPLTPSKLTVPVDGDAPVVVVDVDEKRIQRCSLPWRSVADQAAEVPGTARADPPPG